MDSRYWRTFGCRIRCLASNVRPKVDYLTLKEMGIASELIATEEVTGGDSANDIKPVTLDYAGKGKSDSPAVSISGIVALSSALFQLPWLWLVIVAALAGGSQFSGVSTSSRLESFVYLVVVFAPTIIGVGCAVYSIWVSGFGKRNTSGSTAICLFGCMLLFVLLYTACNWLRSNGYFGYTGWVCC